MYDKVQIKKLPTSEQRISQGKINGVAWTTSQVKKIRVFVQRTPDATEKVSERINIGGYITVLNLYQFIKLNVKKNLCVGL